MNAKGHCDTTAVAEVIRDIREADFKIACAAKSGRVRPVVIKSTVPPGTTDTLNSVYSGGVSVVFNPEFLTEASPVEDFKNQDRIVSWW
jgi:UDP-glucose 6-dehydrogenase